MATLGMQDPAPRWSRSDRLAAASVFLGALALRLLNLQQIRAHDPFFELPSVDPRHYHEWAIRISQGDWLGSDVFYLGPLYPYLLGLLYTVVGPSLFAAKLAQCVIGAGSCVLVWWLARELFDRRVAVLAGAGAALYAMSIFYEGTLMIVNVMIPLVLGVVIATVRGLRRPRALTWLGTGVLLGLAWLARPSVSLYAPLVAVWLLVALRGRLPLARRAALVGAFAAGVAATIAPATLRNYAVGGDFVLVTSTGGYSVWLGNNPGADGAFNPPRVPGAERADDPTKMRDVFTLAAETASGRGLQPSEVSDFWLGEAVAFAREDPLRWLRLELRKLGLFVNATEIWTNRAIELSRPFSWVLRLPLLSFGAVAPLALLGMGLQAPRWRELAPLYGMIGAHVAAALLVFVLARYRMPAVPLLLVFAASAAVWLFDAVRSARWTRLALAAPALAALALVVHLDLGGPSLAMAYYNLGNRYRALGRTEDAIVAYLDALRIDESYMASWNNLALAFEESEGHRADAIEAWRFILDWSLRGGSPVHEERARRHLRALGAVEAAEVTRPLEGASAE